MKCRGYAALPANAFTKFIQDLLNTRQQHNLSLWHLKNGHPGDPGWPFLSTMYAQGLVTCIKCLS